MVYVVVVISKHFDTDAGQQIPRSRRFLQACCLNQRNPEREIYDEWSQRQHGSTRPASST